MNRPTAGQITAIAAAVGLAACGGNSGQSAPPPEPDRPAFGPPVEASATNMLLTSPVGNASTGDPTTDIQATVFLPARLEGQPYPLVLHTHGWGGNRYGPDDAENADPQPGTAGGNFFALLDDRITELQARGMAVISLDQRGFGRGDDGDNGSADGAHIMSPDFEIADARAVIDWAIGNLDLIMDSPGDPRVGAFGGSYGGAFSLMLAASDPRVDAIVPGATWFSLTSALLPNEVLKKGYGDGLCLAAMADMAQLSDEASNACAEGATDQASRFAEDLSDGTRAVFASNGLAGLSAQPGFRMPRVDALMLQGTRDILFNGNEAQNFSAVLRTGGGDVRFFTHEGGHSLRQTRMGPGSQGELGPSTCGDIDVMAAAVDWFDAKLLGNMTAIADLPGSCVSLDDNRGLVLDALGAPVGTDIDFTVVTVSAANNNAASAADEAVFVPLPIDITEPDTVLVGIGGIRLFMQEPAAQEGVAFIGIGIERRGSRFLVDDQVIPVRSSDPRVSTREFRLTDPIELASVAEHLEVGDTLGLLVYGQHDQFENEARTLYASNTVQLEGRVALPVFRATARVREP